MSSDDCDLRSENDRLWFGWTRWRWLTIVLAFMAAMICYAFYVEKQNSDAVAQEAVNASYKTCAASNINRTALRQVVILATEPNGTTDFTQVPGYEDLDPETQTFLVALGSANTQADEDTPNNSFRAEALEILAPRDCDKEVPGHTVEPSEEFPGNSLEEEDE